MLTVSEGALSRARSCCGHASGAHVVRFTDPARGAGLSRYCNTCRTICADSATVTRGAGVGSPWGILESFVKQTKPVAGTPGQHVPSGQDAEPRRTASRRSPFDELIADLQRGPTETPAPRTGRRGAFDELAEGLRRDGARMASGSEPPASEFVVILQEDERGQLRAVRHHVPPSRLERLTAELREASKPPPPTAEEMRADREARQAERGRRDYRRLCGEYRAVCGQAAEQRHTFYAVVAEIEVAVR